MQFGHNVVVSVLKEYLRVLGAETHSQGEKQRLDAGDGGEHHLNHQENAS